MMFANKRILVTGASGYIGSHLVEKLLALDSHVMALGRSKGNIEQFPKSSALDFVHCDISLSDTTIPLVREFAPDVIFHIASHADGPESHRHTLQAIDANIKGTVNLLEAFKDSHRGVFIYGDSCKVYGDAPVPYRENTHTSPNSSYAISKNAGWQMCQLYSQLYQFFTLSIRPTLIYGGRQPVNLISFVMDAIAGDKQEIRLSGGTQTRSPLYIDDAIAAFIAAAQRAHELNRRVINICGKEELSVEKIARLTVDLADSNIPVISNNANARPTEIWRNYCDLSEAAHLLNWSPQHTLREGLLKTLETHFATV